MNNTRIICYNRRMVSRRDIDAAVKQIARQFKPQRITLFGSYAHGNPNDDSDVDLLILMNGKNVHDRALDIRFAIEFGFAVDLIVRSPTEYRQRIKMGDCFLREIDEQGRILYEARGSTYNHTARKWHTLPARTNRCQMA
jgi:uncharacterized protein